MESDATCGIHSPLSLQGPPFTSISPAQMYASNLQFDPSYPSCPVSFPVTSQPKNPKKSARYFPVVCATLYLRLLLLYRLWYVRSVARSHLRPFFTPIGGP